MTKKLLTCLGLLIGAQACAMAPDSTREATLQDSVAPEPVGEASAPIIGGAADAADPAIVLIFVQNTSQEASCSATVVSPHVLLTAAHCLDPVLVDVTVTEPHTYYVFIGDDINNPTQANDAKNFVMVAKTAFDPLFNESVTDPSHDVGVVITATALTMPPLPMNRVALSPEWVGQSVRIVGYGMSMAATPDTSEKKRDGMTTIAGIDDEHEWQSAAVPHMCEGDSGGPTLITRNGVESVAGVHSYIQHGTSCTGNAYDMRTDVDAVPFVDPFIAQYDPGFVPPGDGSSAAGGGGGAGGSGGGSGGTEGSATATGGGKHTTPADSSGCSIGAPSDSSAGVSVLLLATLGLLRSKRRTFRASGA